MTETIDDPIRKSPSQGTDRHYAIRPQGLTVDARDGHGPNESFISIGGSKKGRKRGDGAEQMEFVINGCGDEVMEVIEL